MEIDKTVEPSELMQSSPVDPLLSSLPFQACFCSHCEILLSSTGKFCDNCGVCSHPACIEKTEKNLKCKDKYNKDNKPPGEQKHHWIRGNLPPDKLCVHCKQDLDEDHVPGLIGFRCCWCSRCAHSQCFNLIQNKDTEQCDFGEFASMIIPPSCITAVRRRGTSKLMLKSIRVPQKLSSSEWRPIILVANMKAGSSLAEDILSHYRGILNPLQVIELTRRGPEMVVKWLERLRPVKCRILIAGGDGTVGWIMNTIFEKKVHPLPEIAILPLGTGNDLSRVLLWGSETDSFSHDAAVDMLRHVIRADEIKLDRWLLEMWGAFTRIPLPQKHRHKVYFYNYFSLGVDAQVTLNFHKARESIFYVLSSRMLNKLLYLCFGTHQVLQPDCEGMDKVLELYLDGEKIELPDLQSVVCLNIDSWGAGVQLGELSKGGEGDGIVSSPSDGYLDVYGIVSSFHIAQLQVGLSRPIRLGRARTVKIKLNDTVPVQADGEPWQQIPCEMTLHRVEQANVLKRKN